MCDLLFRSGLIIWLAQMPDDPYPKEPEHTEHPAQHQLESSALTKCLGKGKGEKIKQRMKQEGQKEPASLALATLLQHHHGECSLQVFRQRQRRWFFLALLF